MTAASADSATRRDTGLTARLARLIAVEGPLTVAQFMMLCLHDPTEGYYATRPALGAGGDFVTAPEVSQMFGEMLGLWAASAWDALGRPAPFRLVELGPGTGALMSDLLRAGRALPDFLAAADLWLVEASAPLREQQAGRLAAAHPQFARGLDEVPGGAPIILIANEFLDCQPVRQFVRRDGDWWEQRVGLDDAGALTFGLWPAPGGLEAPADAPEGAVFEQSPAQAAIAQQIAERIVEDGGAALLIDYGRDQPGLGDTLQALAGHAKVDPLACPGAADLTAHVDFPAMAAAAAQTGATVSPIISQGALLQTLGVALRAETLMRSRPDLADMIARQLRRLVGEGEMGLLFKALAIHSLTGPVPGFESPDPAPAGEARA